MATKKKPAKEANAIVVTEADKEKKSIVLSKITVMSIDRSSKDIGKWMEAIESAESIYYPNRSDLYDIYSRVELDGFLSGVWEKRIAMLLNKKIRYVDKEGKKIDELDSLITSKEFRRMLRLFMLSKSHGISGMEFIPGPQFTFIEIPRKHIEPHSRTIINYQTDQKGISYDNLWNVLIVGHKDDLGFLQKVTPYVLWKQGNYGDWADFVEKFGQPKEIFTYDVWDDKTKEESTKIMKETGAGTRMLIPKQLDYKMEDGKTSNANGELQNKLKDACNDEISIIVLGVTETTKSSSSSGYAQSETHSQQQDEIIKCDQSDILHFLNAPQLIKIIRSYGYPVIDEGMFQYEHEVDLNEVKTKLDIALSISKRQPVDDDYLYELTGIPKPENYDALKEEMKNIQQPLPPADPPNPDPVRSRNKGNKKQPENQKAGKKAWQRFLDFFSEAR